MIDWYLCLWIDYVQNMLLKNYRYITNYLWQDRHGRENRFTTDRPRELFRKECFTGSTKETGVML